MACACGKHSVTNTATSSTSTTVSALYAGVDTLHTILPTQSCIFCAEKHIANAISLLSRYGVRTGYRLAALGEFEAARRHTQLEYKDVATAIATIEKKLLISSIYTTEDLEALTHVLNTALANTNNGVDTTGATSYLTVNESIFGIENVSKHPLVGILLVACAWRLAIEVGYEKANRLYLIGDLAEAQVQIMGIDLTLSQDVRQLRHDIQVRNMTNINNQWASVINKLDIAQTTTWKEKLTQYGTDISYALEPPVLPELPDVEVTETPAEDTAVTSEPSEVVSSTLQD